MINYIESLEFKFKSAKYHKEKSLEYISKPILFENNEDSYIVAVSSEFTAMMLTFQSSIDILAQHINEKRSLGFDKEKIYFSSLKELIYKNELNLGKLNKHIKELNKKSRYLFSYCNTVKHRNLIVIKKNSFFISPFQIIDAFYVEEFKSFPEMELRALIISTEQEIMRKINEIITLV